MKLKMLRTLVALILGGSIIISPMEINCVGIDDSPNREMLKQELIYNAIKDLKEIEIIEIEQVDDVDTINEIEEDSKVEIDKKVEETKLTKIKENNKVETKKEEKEVITTKVEKTETEMNNEKVVKDEKRSLGTFMLTAYCGCKECCEQYAIDRPVDENGNEIVYGSIGKVLTQGKSIAVDPNVIPYDTKVVINGSEYIAHDTGGAIKGNRIDIYFIDHQEANKFGVKYAEVFVYND